MGNDRVRAENQMRFVFSRLHISLEFPSTDNDDSVRSSATATNPVPKKELLFAFVLDWLQLGRISMVLFVTWLIKVIFFSRTIDDRVKRVEKRVEK